MMHEIAVIAQMYGPTLEALDATYTAHSIWKAADKKAAMAAVKDRVRAIAASGGSNVNAELLDALPKAEVVCCFGVGVDGVDLAECKRRGIPVTNTPDVLTDEVADLTMGLVLASARRIVTADKFVRAGDWLKGSLGYGHKIGGRTMGILGCGRIGQAVARRAEAFGMTVVYSGTRQRPELAYRFYPDLVAMAEAVDFLVLTLPGGAATKHIVNAAVLKALGPKGTLVNVARGSVVDEAALVQALQDGTLGAAALDVFEKEPHVPPALFAMDNVVLQPHQASATFETRQAMGQLVLDNLAAHFAGKPLVTQVL